MIGIVIAFFITFQALIERRSDEFPSFYGYRDRTPATQDATPNLVKPIIFYSRFQSNSL
jgi:hypothetical protein